MFNVFWYNSEVNKDIALKIEDFFKNYKFQTYKKGEIILRADDNPQGIFYLTKGLVKMYSISKKGDEVILNIFKPISFFPMTWGLNETPNAYYFEAMEDTNLYRAPREKVVLFLERNPDVALDLLKRLYRGVDGMLIKMTYLMSARAHTRLMMELIIHAQRFGKKTKGNAVMLKISEGELAASSGMTRETASREISRLKEEGLITFRQNMLEIKDLNKLSEMLIED